MKLTFILILISMCFQQGAQAQQTEEAVDKFAQFTDGSDKFYEYIKKSVKYPVDARMDSLTGEVYVEFVIDVNGAILPKSIKILKSLSASCDAEAVRVIKGAPKWIPGSTKTASIQQTISFPVSFVFE